MVHYFPEIHWVDRRETLARPGLYYSYKDSENNLPLVKNDLTVISRNKLLSRLLFDIYKKLGVTARMYVTMQ